MIPIFWDNWDKKAPGVLKIYISDELCRIRVNRFRLSQMDIDKITEICNIAYQTKVEMGVWRVLTTPPIDIWKSKSIPFSVSSGKGKEIYFTLEV